MRKTIGIAAGTEAIVEVSRGNAIWGFFITIYHGPTDLCSLNGLNSKSSQSLPAHCNGEVLRKSTNFHISYKYGLNAIGPQRWSPCEEDTCEGLATRHSARIVSGHEVPSGRACQYLGSRRESFVDHFLMAPLNGTALQLRHSQRAEVALKRGRPWESVFAFNDMTVPATQDA